MAANKKKAGGDILSILSSKEALAGAASGATAQIVCTLILFPLDSIKIMVQTDKNASVFSILKEYAEKGKLGKLYAGMESKLVQSPQSKFQYFYVSAILKTLYKSYTNSSEISVRDSLLIGYLSALQGLGTTLPLDVLTNRMITRARNHKGEEKLPSMLETFFSIWKEEGFASFYRSLNASLVLCINPAITYVVFDKIKAYLLSRKADGVQFLTTFEAFLAGALSKAIAATITFPAVRAKTRMTSFKKKANANNADADEKAPGMLDHLKAMLDEGGILEWYRGIGPQISKGILQEALMLAMKERISEVVTKIILGGARK